MVELDSKNLKSRLFKFVSTQEGAELSGYTSDYVAKLARDGVVLAKKDTKGWLVDAESLKLYALEVEARKRAKAKALRDEQKRISYSQVDNLRRSVLAERTKTPAVMIALQAGVVTTCIALLAVLSSHSKPAVANLSSLVENISLANVSSQVALLPNMAGVVNPQWLWIFRFEDEAQLVANEDVVSKPPAVRSAPAIDEKGMVVLDEFDSRMFSDEVHMTFVVGETGTITPKFEEGAYRQYPFVLKEDRNDTDK